MGNEECREARQNGKPVMKPEWSPTINLGQIAQIATVIIMMAGAYASLRNDIATSEQRAIKESGTIAARVSILEARREMDERFQTDATRDLRRLLDAVADIRVQLAGKAERRGDLGLPP